MQRGKRIGPCDKLVLWNKPKSRPKGLSLEEFAALPKDLVLREVHYYIAIPGFRTPQVTLITTLLDAVEYPIGELMRRVRVPVGGGAGLATPEDQFGHGRVAEQNSSDGT
jgi:hypothetical protein